jgi:pentatricopeptide repeat protein
MTDLLQEQIEDYVAGVMPETDKVSFEEKIKSDTQLRQQVIETQRLREILLRSRVFRQVEAARAEISQPKKGRELIFMLGGFVAAASIFLFTLSSPVMLTSQEFNYRGETTISQGSESRLNDFEKAKAIINKGDNPQEAIKILEKLTLNPEISSNYQRNSKWMLVIAYLQNGKTDKAEETFNKIICEGIECPYSTWEKTKIKWQIFWGKN